MRIPILFCVCDIVMTRSTARSHAGQVDVPLLTSSWCFLIVMVFSVTRLVESRDFFAPYRDDGVWDSEYTTSATNSWMARSSSPVLSDVW